MAEYLKQVKMQEYNDTYQQAQLDIVLEGQRNLVSQAEIMNRLNELKTQIANQTAQSIIPLARTNAPEVVKPITPQVAKKIEEKIKYPKRISPKLPPLTSGEKTPTLLALSPTSTEATFQQTSMGSPEVKKGKKEASTLTGKTTKDIKNEFAKIKSPITLENIEIRVENNKPVFKDLNSGIDIVKPDAKLLQRLYNEYKIKGNGIKSKASASSGSRREKKMGMQRNAKGQFTRA